MTPEQLKQLVKSKRRWSDSLTADDKKRGFKGWYASKNLPHFDGAGTRQFITYRLADSLPASRRSERAAYLAPEDDLEKQRKIEAYLDKGLGECYLRDPRIAELIQRNLWHHDGVKYRLLAWVIMPNHVHVLVEVWKVPMGSIVRDWKGYTSKEAWKLLQGGGSSSLLPDLEGGDEPSPPRTFWEEDYFDCYLRDDDHYRRVVHYIENNPNKAGLVKSPTDWAWSSARYRAEPGPVVPVFNHPSASPRSIRNSD